MVKKVYHWAIIVCLLAYAFLTIGAIILCLLAYAFLTIGAIILCLLVIAYVPIGLWRFASCIMIIWDKCKNHLLKANVYLLNTPYVNHRRVGHIVFLIQFHPYLSVGFSLISKLILAPALSVWWVNQWLLLGVALTVRPLIYRHCGLSLVITVFLPFSRCNFTFAKRGEPMAYSLLAGHTG